MGSIDCKLKSFIDDVFDKSKGEMLDSMCITITEDMVIGSDGEMVNMYDMYLHIRKLALLNGYNIRFKDQDKVIGCEITISKNNG